MFWTIVGALLFVFVGLPVAITLLGAMHSIYRALNPAPVALIANPGPTMPFGVRVKRASIDLAINAAIFAGFVAIVVALVQLAIAAQS